MAKGVFTHRVNTTYDDQPEVQYQFPKRYLNRAKAFEDDWIVYYEPRRGNGRLGYNAIAKVAEIIADPSADNMFIAVIEQGSYLPLDVFVPYRDELTGIYLESGLANDDGALNRGLMQWAVRAISERDFFRILALGFPAENTILPRRDNPAGAGRPDLQEDARPFIVEPERMRVEQTITRALRDRVFRRKVLDAYDSRCALTGFKFTNGHGRAEVEAAHIRPVAHNGPDAVHNGVALSGTVHWMFDRGLISLSDDLDILVSRQLNNSDEIWRLVNANRRARPPANDNLRPHAAYLEWHRQNCFKA